MRDLHELGVRCALVGGLGVSVRAEPRFTRDVDLALGVESDHEAEQIVRSLIEKGYQFVAQIEHETTKRLAAVRLSPAGLADDGLVIDLLFASSGIERELVEEAESIEVLPELSIPVARLEHLLALKILARDDRTRPQDRTDIGLLLRKASRDETAAARRSLQRITERGFHRSRDLMRALDDALREFAAQA